MPQETASDVTTTQAFYRSALSALVWLVCTAPALAQDAPVPPATPVETVEAAPDPVATDANFEVTSQPQSPPPREPQWGSSKGEIITVGSPYLELYVFPGRGFPRFHALEKGERLRMFKKRSDWYKVETTDGKQGWVRKRDLQTIYDQDGYLLDFSTPTWSDNKYPLQLGLLLGRVENSLAYTLYTGYRFTPNLSTELKFTHAFGDFSNTKLGSLMIVHQAFPHWRVSPFFTLGGGIIRTSQDPILIGSEQTEATDTEDTALTVGGGLMIYLSHRLMARVEYNQHNILTTRENNLEVEEWKAGFSVFF